MPLSSPDVAEMCQTLSEFLTDEIKPQIASSELQYKLKIALNMLSIIARESQQGAALATFEQRSLSAYLGVGAGEGGSAESLNTRLSEHIANADIAAESAGLLDMLEGITLGKMAIDNPRYSSYLKRVKN